MGLQASYGVEDAEYAVTQLAQTTMRSEIGQITLDNVFKEREVLNQNIVGKPALEIQHLFTVLCIMLVRIINSSSRSSNVL